MLCKVIMNKFLRTANVFRLEKQINQAERLSVYWRRGKPLAARSFSVKEDNNAPIKYTRSPAARWQAKFSRTGIATPRLSYEPYVIVASIAAFLIYFCALREENGMDKELEKSLYSRITGLEEVQLMAALKHNQNIGGDTAAIQARLQEIQTR